MGTCIGRNNRELKGALQSARKRQFREEIGEEEYGEGRVLSRTKLAENPLKTEIKQSIGSIELMA